MRKGRFPPFGFVSSEFWLCALVLQEFLAVFGYPRAPNRAPDGATRLGARGGVGPAGRAGRAGGSHVFSELTIETLRSNKYFGLVSP